jgi:hypothetical protein
MNTSETTQESGAEPTVQVAAPARANIYTLLDQRLVPYGKPLHVLIRLAAETLMKTVPTSISELRTFVCSFLGRWHTDPAQRVAHQTILCMEHLRLLDEIAAADGEQPALDAEEYLHRLVSKQINTYRELGIHVWNGVLTQAAEVTTANAWSALNERCLSAGFPLHEELKAWVLARKDSFVKQVAPTNVVGYLMLAKQFSGTWPLPQVAPAEKPTRLQQAFVAFMDEIAAGKGQNQAVAVQSALCDSFSRSIKKHVREQGFDAHLSALNPLVPPAN